MKKVIFSQVMTDNGTAEFSGVYDRNRSARKNYFRSGQ